MAESFEVIALISGGKDSFYSLLHCLQNGHKVVALGNLYPSHGITEEGADEEEQDLNSWMYQTVGHNLIPLYEELLGISLYRQPITGIAVHTGTSYGPGAGGEEDETESLVPLIQRIMAAHPTANALSTGAILSTYQRTRIESVALRLGLTPLSYLWQYPILPPCMQSSLLSDMAAVGLDARIIKVASGGLDESFLWANVADPLTTRRIERAMGRFGVSGDGAVLGEGGEFETLVVDGPASVFMGRIVVKEEDKRVVREGGGAAWLRILSARVVMKETGTAGEEEESCRIPDLLEGRFMKILEFLESDSSPTLPILEDLNLKLSSSPDLFALPSIAQAQSDSLHWTVHQEASKTDTISDQASKLTSEIKDLLHQASLEATSITSTTIILRSMSDFAAVNKIYGALFTQPNPPSRVTISCGSTLPPHTNISIHLTIHSPSNSTPTPARKALHVQSRSYWAPANIGPYSQAISIPQPLASEDSNRSWAVSIAGQIPLVPHTMILPTPTPGNEEASFRMQTVLSLQHLVRIGIQMDVQWFTHTVAYFPSPTTIFSPDSKVLTTKHKAILASKAWSYLHNPFLGRTSTDESQSDGDEEEDERDLWEEKHYASLHTHSIVTPEKLLPDHTILSSSTRKGKNAPPFWAAEVEELPRGASIEWGSGLGIVGSEGSVQIYKYTVRNSFIIHQCVFACKVFSIIMIAYGTTVEIEDRLVQARAFLPFWKETASIASWIDVHVSREVVNANAMGIVPCKSLWDSGGDRLAAVFVSEICLGIEAERYN